jgi:hypothetical protein
MAEGGERFIDLGDKRRVVLTQSDVDFIKDNPHGLTKEGCQVSLVDWAKHSKNRYVQARYKAMLEKCKSFTKSGKLSDGKTVLSRDSEEEVTWAEFIDVDFNRLNRTAWQQLDEVKKY